MLAPLPSLEDYGLSPVTGFLPEEAPLQRLPDPYYAKWESIVSSLQALLLSHRLRPTIDNMPILSTANLNSEPEWRRAYVLLAFMLHAYVWGGDSPAEIIPKSISIPFLEISAHHELPPVATYSGLCLWNYKPIFPGEPADNIENITSLHTFTGSLDEQWFYLVSIAMESHGASTIPLMLNAIAAARQNNTQRVIECLRTFAQCIDEISDLLQRMYENCDPHVFYHRIRPFLAGSRNMSDAGLPDGIIYDDGTGSQTRHYYSGGSNAQSSLIQFFDIVLNIEHLPTGEKRTEKPDLGSSPSSDDQGSSHARAKRHNFIMEMRSYMPGPHRRFLEHVASVANIRDYVLKHSSDSALCAAYDSCLAVLRAMRDKHIQMVSRYIIIKAREARMHQTRSASPRAAPGGHGKSRAVNLASPVTAAGDDEVVAPASASGSSGGKNLRGTGGTPLIPFLKQARDETGEPAVGLLVKELAMRGPPRAVRG
ncbi:indoleamine 2,3-dioxygenase [Blastomyces parvus]|uniref:Indoleamine 2,3-dioxygenase n=1 Tax=Blastomyces parvus TaxID=2060905 RepID=A0A2B7XKL1_9EURO|nr:indoleamine 2,3-dioxygenase [Blastomyces parvus]